jgi:sulfite reductase (NADPH) flavoprotein alpha-component
MSTESPYSRKNPFPSQLVVNRKLTLDGSEKETRHFEFSLEGSGVVYEVGDSLGVLPKNCRDLVDEIIRALHATGNEPVPGNDGAVKTLGEALLADYQITQPSKQFIQALAERGGEGTSLLREFIETDRKQDLEAHLWGMEYIDFLVAHPSVKFTPEEFVKFLRKLQPRLYSIASSLKANPEAVHLTVAIVRYESHGRKRKGVTTTYLAERVEPGGRVPVFVHTAKGFRLPEDGCTPIIMVGPGTGIAPFRAFLQERKATGATGRNWLFFGEQHEKSDFLYRAEFEAMKNEGVLTRLDTAFSRDQAQKIYVQHRMLENAGKIWKWLEEGAHFFVCGDAKRMAKDVDVALHSIVEKEGGRTGEQAAEYVEDLKKAKRYKRDVY